MHSYNTLYAQLILQVGPQNGVDMAKKLGITSTLKALPSAVLGANDVTPLDMASAYGSFANRGVHVEGGKELGRGDGHPHARGVPLAGGEVEVPRRVRGDVGDHGGAGVVERDEVVVALEVVVVGL